MKGIWKAKGLIVVAIALVLALVASSVTPVAAAEKKTVKIGVQCAITGGAAATGLAYFEGETDYFRYVNEEKGGVNGYPIEVMWVDTGLDPSKSVMAYRRQRDAGCVMIDVHMTAPYEAMFPHMVKDEIPCTGSMGHNPAGTKVQAGNTWFIEPFPSNESFLGYTFEWMAEQVERRPMRLGVIALDYLQTRILEAGIPSVVEAINAKHGTEVIEYVGAEWAPITTIDTSIELIRLADKDVDWVFMIETGTITATTIKDVKRLGLMEQGIGFVCLYAGLDATTIKMAGKEACEGFYVQRDWPVNTMPQYPGVQLAFEMGKKYRGYEPEEVSCFYIAGTSVFGVGIEEWARLALEKVSIEDLNGRTFRDYGMFRMKDFDFGLGQGLTTITPSKPWITNGGWIYQIQNGRQAVVSDFMPYWFFPPYLETMGTRTTLLE